MICQSEHDALCVRGDPDAPKRPVGPYQYFVHEKQMELKGDETYPYEDIAYVDTLKMIAGLWKNLTEDDRKKYVALAASAKEDYMRDIQNYSREEGEKRKKARHDAWRKRYALNQKAHAIEMKDDLSHNKKRCFACKRYGQKSALHY